MDVGLLGMNNLIQPSDLDGSKTSLYWLKIKKVFQIGIVPTYVQSNFGGKDYFCVVTSIYLLMPKLIFARKEIFGHGTQTSSSLIFWCAM